MRVLANWCASVLVGIMCLVIPSGVSFADESLGPDEIVQFVKQLGSKDFSERVAAVQKLQAAGEAAVGPLAEAARGDDAEARLRAMKLLSVFYRGKDQSLRKKVKPVLETIAAGDDTAARRAARLLAPTAEDFPPGNWQGRETPRTWGMSVVMSGIRITGGTGGVVIRGGTVKIGGPHQVAVTKIAGGRRVVDVIQGSGRGILIRDDAKGGDIEIYVRTPTTAGDSTFRTARADNLEHLKKQAPDLAALYQKFDANTKPGVRLTPAVE